MTRLLERASIAEFLSTFGAVSQARRGRKRAAVACVLAPDTVGELSFLLTRRASSLRRHRGQYALPGGRVDAGEGVESAARRELHEEVGVELDHEAVLGRLDDYVTRSGYVITPVVLWSDHPPRLRLAPAEVAAAYRITFRELDRPDMPRLQTIEESERPVLSVPVRGHFVHAPTAAVIYQLWEMVWRSRRVTVADYEQPLFAWR